MTTARQTTISTGLEFVGVGIHSGTEAVCILEPAEADAGHVVQLMGCAPVRLDLERVISTDHATVIRIGEHKLSTIEHLLSALRGLGIDNVNIALTGEEVPILDGSARPFVEELVDKVRTLDAPRKILRVTDVVRYEEGDKYIEFRPCTGEAHYTIHCSIDFAHPVIGRREATYVMTPDVYRREIAGARTFGFLKEVEHLKANGLIKGAGLENAVVFDDAAVVNPPMRWEDEPLRHKVLDCVGDLSLLGHGLAAKVHVHKGGHGVHTRGARRLVDSGCWELCEG